MRTERIFARTCGGCGHGFLLEEFRADEKRTLGRTHTCHICVDERLRDGGMWQADGQRWYNGETVREGRLRVRETRAKLYRSRARLREEVIKERTPAWANLPAIRAFYRDCPAGYHVDHIIPLRGEEINGLHVLANLQYLLAADNLKKGNRFTPTTKG